MRTQMELSERLLDLDLRVQKGFGRHKCVGDHRC